MVGLKNKNKKLKKIQSLGSIVLLAMYLVGVGWGDKTPGMFFFTCVTRSMFSGSWFSRAPPQSTVILLALQRHCKCEFLNINLQLVSNLAKLWAQSSCRCCQCGQNEQNQGLGVEEGQKELGEEDHQLGHHHNNPAP